MKKYIWYNLKDLSKPGWSEILCVEYCNPFTASNRPPAFGIRRSMRFWSKSTLFNPNADSCLYIDTKQNIYIMIWVDDLLIVGKNWRDIAAVKVQLAGEFEMKDLGELKHFLGMRITRNPNGRISTDQSGYIHQVLEWYGMLNSKPVSTPLAPGACLIKATKLDDRDVDLKLYQGIVGSIMHGMLCTCPDLAFSIQQLSQFNSNPANMHFQAGKWAMRCLQGTQAAGPIYKGEIMRPVQAYCDVDYGAGEDRKSISSYIFLLAGASISWQAKKQTSCSIDGRIWICSDGACGEGINLASTPSMRSWNVEVCAKDALSRQPMCHFAHEEPNALRQDETHWYSTPLHLRSYRKGDDQCEILPYGGYACGSHDKRICEGLTLEIVGIDGNQIMWTNRYAITSWGCYWIWQGPWHGFTE